jgi:hypothetical protein
LKSSSPRSSSRDHGITPDAVIVATDHDAAPGTVGEGSPGGQRELGPIRLPLKNAGDFILKFNEYYRSLGLELHQYANEKIPDSQETAEDLNDESSSSATDHLT